MKFRTTRLIWIGCLIAIIAGCDNKLDGVTPPISNQMLNNNTTVPDTTPPTVLSVNPPDGATNIGVGTALVINFSEAVYAGPNSNPVVLVLNGLQVTGSIFIKSGSGGTSWIFYPDAPLQGGSMYDAAVTTEVIDAAGNAMAANYTWRFTTSTVPDLMPPVVTAVTPTNGALNVSVNTAVSAAFNETILASSVTTASFLLTSPTTTVTAVVSSAGGVATLTPSARLASNTKYTATLTTGITDLALNALVTNYSWTFTTVPAPSITTTTLPAGTETGAYSQQLTATGGYGTLTWTTPSTLPTGLSLSTGGLLSGTIATGTAGTYTINVTVTDADGVTATTSLSLTVGVGPSIVESTLKQATATGAYSQTLTGTGGTSPYTWSASGLPSGVTLSTTGPSPTTTLTSANVTAVAGTYSITITITDANSIVATKNLSLIVNAKPAIDATQVLPEATETGTYSYTVLLTNSGTGTLTWSQNGLPSGMTFDTATGTIGGAPGPGTAGAYSVGFTVTDSNLVSSATVTLPLTVNPPPTISSVQADLDAVGAASESGGYAGFTPAASGGTGTLTWNVAGLPGGMSFSTSTGAISGTPAAGTSASSPYAITFTVTDSYGVQGAPVVLSLTVIL